MKHRLFILLLLLGSSITLASNKRLSFHLIIEPHSFDPILIRGVTGSYLFNNIYRGLYRYTSKGLIPEGAKSCKWENPLRLTCDLQKRKYSDGTAITASHYVTSFQRVFQPGSKSLQSARLLTLKNARKILDQKASPNALGIKAIGNHQLQFDLDEADPELLYKLAYPALAPLKTTNFPSRKNIHKLLVNGPYKLESWKLGSKLKLVSNPHYDGKKRPGVDILFLEDHTTAARFYDTGQLSFLRQVPTAEIPVVKNSSDFRQYPMDRMDYIGFGPQIKNLDLRKALAHSLNFVELQKIYHSEGLPGCLGLRDNLIEKELCYAFDLKKAKAHLSKVPKEVLKKPLSFSYIKIADFTTGMQWMQDQWKKHLGLQVNLNAHERGMYLNHIKYSQPPLFRKSFAMERPTCLGALEAFHSEDPENYIHFKNKSYDDSLVKLAKATGKQKKSRCYESAKVIMDSYVFIPTGPIHFSTRLQPFIKGLDLTSTNALDLTALTLR